jgi:hypothetical protein
LLFFFHFFFAKLQQRPRLQWLTPYFSFFLFIKSS